MERDTLYLHREHYDSIYILQDRYQDRSRDTVYLREHTVEYRYRLLHDTLREVRIDSIPYPFTVVRTQEVERPLGWFDHLTRFTFWTSAAALLLFIHLKIKKIITMQLTEHFSLQEFTHSDTARCLGIDNTPPPEAIDNLRRLCIHVLEPLRRHVARPIHINSGYRCPTLNLAVVGRPESLHLQGCAADLRIPSTREGREWMTWIIDHCTFNKVIWETADRRRYWIHVSYVEGQNQGHVVPFLLHPGRVAEG